jgi:cell division protein FtsB
MITNYSPYIVTATACFLLIYFSITSFFLFRLHARVRDLTQATRDLDYAELANLIGDVAALKVSLKKTNGRITGLDSPKYNLEEQIAHGLAQTQQTNVRQIGG